MILHPVPTVPLVVAGVVPADQGSVGVALPATLDRLTLVLSTAGATAQLNAAAVAALRDLLADAAGRMATLHQPAADRCACGPLVCCARLCVGC